MKRAGIVRTLGGPPDWAPQVLFYGQNARALASHHPLKTSIQPQEMRRLDALA
jgi:hypothetical protein